MLRRRGLVALVVAVLVAIAVVGAWLRMRSAASVPTREQVLAAVLARADDDHDGRLSRQEWKRYGGDDALFDRYDVNHDGYLDLTEFSAQFQATDPRSLEGR